MVGVHLLLRPRHSGLCLLAGSVRPSCLPDCNTQCHFLSATTDCGVFVYLLIYSPHILQAVHRRPLKSAADTLSLSPSSHGFHCVGICSQHLADVVTAAILCTCRTQQPTSLHGHHVTDTQVYLVSARGKIVASLCLSLSLSPSSLLHSSLITRVGHARSH